VWQGSTVGVAYGGTGVTTSSGANSVMLRDANQNVTINRLNQTSNTITAAGGTTTLTAASAFSQILNGTGGQTFKLPDATTLTNTTTFEFNNNATGTLTITDYANATVGTISSGGAAAIALLSNATVGGTWDVHAYIPESVTWGTNSLVLGSTVITGGTWNGGTIATGYGGTGLTSYTSGGAVYANSSSTLTSGTLPLTAGGTAATTAAGARTSLDVPSTTGSGASGTWGINISGNSATTSQTNFSNLTIGGSQVLYAGNYSSYALPLTGGTLTGLEIISVSNSTATNTTGSHLRLENPTGTQTTIGFTFAGTAKSSLRADGDGNFILNSSNNAYYWNYELGSTTFTFRNSTGSVFQSMSGTTVNFPGALQQGGNTVLTSANYNSYAPTLTGTGATGTWAINITGSAGTISGNTVNDYFRITNTGGSQRLLMGNQDSAGVNNPSMMIAANGVFQFGNGNSWSGSGGTFTNYSEFNTSFISHTSSIRAPIFYDSDNTAYYVNPASSSLLSVLSVGGSSGNNTMVLGNGDGIRLFNDGSASIKSQIYFANGANNKAFNWQLDASGNAALWGYPSGPGWNLTGYVTPSGIWYAVDSFRAPIFYDSNDTTYYVDPNSTGVALSTNGILVAGTGTSGGIQNRTYTGGRNRIWSFANADTYGMSFFQGGPDYIGLHVSGTATQAGSDFWVSSGGISQTSVSSRAPIFYDSNDTSYYLDPNSTSRLSAVSVLAGSVGFVNAARGSYYGYSSGYGTLIYGVTSGNVTPCFNVDPIGNPSGAFGGNGNEVMFRNGVYFISPNSANNGYQQYFQMLDGATIATNSFRAPIFYDSNDTGYYVDPNGSISASFAGQINVYRNDTQTVFQTYNTSAGSPGQFNIRHDYGNVILENTRGVTYVYGSYVQTNNSLRAPIFYDSDNTGYYLDPASTSTIGNLYVTGIELIGTTTRYNQEVFSALRSSDGSVSSVGAVARFMNSGSGRVTKLTFTDNAIIDGIMCMTPVSAGNSWFSFGFAGYTEQGLQVFSDGRVIATSNMRAPIFYDSDNTTYYVDPNGTSSMFGVAIRGDQNSTDTSNQIFFWGAGTTTTSAIGFKSNGGYFPNPTGNGDGYNTYLTMDSDGRGWVFRRGVGGSDFTAAYTSGWILNNGVWQANASMRAPIFYDSNNTGYYCDPNSTSNFAGLTVANTISGSISGNSASVAGLVPSQFYNNMGNDHGTYTDFNNIPTFGCYYVQQGNNGPTGVASNQFYGFTLGLGVQYPLSYYGSQFYYPRAAQNSTTYIYIRDREGGSWGSWRKIYAGWADAPSGSTFAASGDFRAPIFYDSNDTGYYLNPNGSSNLFSVTTNDWYYVNGGSGVYWNSYGRGIRAADNEYSYGNIGTYGGGLNGWRGYGVYPNNSILMSNGSSHGWYNPQYGWMFIMDGVGNVTFGNNVTAYSDLRLKNNVREIDNVVERRDALALAAIKYERDGRTRIGYGAQTLRDHGCAEFVHEADDALKIVTGMGTLSVDYGETTAILAVTSKMTDDRVAALEAKVQQLLEIINELRNS
jgi:hypothetical protein